MNRSRTNSRRLLLVLLVVAGAVLLAVLGSISVSCNTAISFGGDVRDIRQDTDTKIEPHVETTIEPPSSPPAPKSPEANDAGGARAGRHAEQEEPAPREVDEQRPESLRP